MTSKLWKVFAAGTLMLLAQLAQAAVSGQIQARLTLIAGCEVTNGTGPDSPVSDFGSLDFGQQGPTWNNPIKASLSDDARGKLNVACNPAVTGFTVTIDGGTHGDGNTRRLSNGTQTIPYRLYQDAARRIPLAVDVPMSGRVPDSGSVDLPLYARIEPLAEIPRVSRYSDLVKVTVSW